MSIQAVKAVSVGDGIESGSRRGSEQHDPIGYDAAERRFTRPTNRAGGIEGGISNGEIVLLGRLWGVPTPHNRALQLVANRMARNGQKSGAVTLDELEQLAMQLAAR